MESTQRSRMKGALIPCGEAGDQRRSRFKLAGKSPEALWSGKGGAEGGGADLW